VFEKESFKMQIWEYTSVILNPQQSWYDVLTNMGQQGWEAWHMEIPWGGPREIFFKKKAS